MVVDFFFLLQNHRFKRNKNEFKWIFLCELTQINFYNISYDWQTLDQNKCQTLEIYYFNLKLTDNATFNALIVEKSADENNNRSNNLYHQWSEFNFFQTFVDYFLCKKVFLFYFHNLWKWRCLCTQIFFIRQRIIRVHDNDRAIKSLILIFNRVAFFSYLSLFLNARCDTYTL